MWKQSAWREVLAGTESDGWSEGRGKPRRPGAHKTTAVPLLNQGEGRSDDACLIVFFELSDIPGNCSRGARGPEERTTKLDLDEIF